VGSFSASFLIGPKSELIGKKPKRGEVRHAEIRSGERYVRLTAVLTPDGWLAGVSDICTEEWESQEEWPDPESAVAQLEWYARQVLNVTDPIRWSDDPF